MKTSDRKKIFVALSGGVDSSVAAALLLEHGFNVLAVHIKCYNIDGCGERDAEDARRVTQHLKIPFYVFDFEEEYKKRVVDYMVDGYLAGLTPNPDVMCNKEIKFGLFLRRALDLGADYVATGHYVRLWRGPVWGMPRSAVVDFPGEEITTRSSASLSPRQLAGRTMPARPPQRAPRHHPSHPSSLLFEAKDKNKDQSYFLWTLTQEQLKHCLFPIGEYTKPQVRTLARKLGLPTANKKDSQGICFLGKVTLADFLKNYIPQRRGELLSVAGEKLGEHDGAYFYTIGQRHGFYSNILKNIGITPHYVVEKNTATNTLVVAEGENNPALYRKEIFLKDVNFINPNLYTPIPIPLYARVRYRQPLAKAALESYPSTSLGFRLVFDKPQKFVAPGQSAVFYNNKGKMLGGGVIV